VCDITTSIVDVKGILGDADLFFEDYKLASLLLEVKIPTLSSKKPEDKGGAPMGFFLRARMLNQQEFALR
jgi:hypothetical protein